MSAYLFIHFSMKDNEDDENIWLSVSRDGLHWQDIGGEEPALKSRIGTKGIRDPFIVFDEKLKKYFVIATDLNTRICSWGDAVTKGSRSILVWESENLIDWSEPRLVEVGVKNAGCVWAPEAVYCKENNSWFVYWASCVKESADKTAKQRIYGAFTNDFESFTPAFKYLEGKTDIIDTDIVYASGRYYRFSKDETHKRIIAEFSEKLISDSPYERIPSPLLDSLEGVEGPQAYYLEKEKKWCLIVDRYRTQGGYMPLIADDISKGNFEELPESSYDMGIRKKRHGGVIAVPDKIYEELTEHYGIYKKQ